MKILTVVGARPQFIKAEPLSRAFVERGHEHVLVHTGQHWDSSMSQVFFDEMDLPSPAINLGVGSGSHGRQTGEMLGRVEEALIASRPDWVVVLGDTNSTLAGALAAVKLHIPLAHVEAGLRSFNRRMPEEVNRVLTDHAANVLFTPTSTAVENLDREGIRGDRVRLVGDVMYDAFKRFVAIAQERSSVFATLGVGERPYVLTTVHRAENTDDPERLTMILEALRAVAENFEIILPLHPRTRAAMDRMGLRCVDFSPIRFIEPLGYLDMLALESRAAVIASDSGGVQKEAFFSRVPCVTLRDETEWTELISLGWNRLCPPVSSDAVSRAIEAAAGAKGDDVELYGGGESARRIAAALDD